MKFSRKPNFEKLKKFFLFNTSLKLKRKKKSKIKLEWENESGKIKLASLAYLRIIWHIFIR